MPSVGKFSLTLAEPELVAKKKAKWVKCLLNSRKIKKKIKYKGVEERKGVFTASRFCFVKVYLPENSG